MTSNPKTPEGNNENPLSSDPSRVGNQLCFADLCATNQQRPEFRKFASELLAVIEKHADAMNKNDAAAAAALFTEDAVYMTDRGLIKGREAIEKMYADLFQKLHFSRPCHHGRSGLPSHRRHAMAKTLWATGGWSWTIQVQNSDPVQIKGFWSVIYVREGDDLKIRMFSP